MLKSTIMRFFAFTIVFTYLLPCAFSMVGCGDNFAFHGGLLTAILLGLSYIAVMLSAFILFGVVANPLNLSDETRKKIWPFTAAYFCIATVFFLLGARYVPFLGLTVSGWLPALIGCAVSLVVMVYTTPRSLGEFSGKAIKV